MHGPVPLELTKIALGRLLVVNLEVIRLVRQLAVPPHLDLFQPLRRQPQRELVAPPLVLEAIDAAESLSHGDVEDEMGHGEEADGDPAVAAL
uniref:Uncharacterized protein n=1 Tax=Nelumbo nucifera TaxID=4432 RepID=A0A822Z659_NELNU|nr:TPA_asm: hypothetical protein HUJ06_014366 [Nelumbo nucifera]